MMTCKDMTETEARELWVSLSSAGKASLLREISHSLFGGDDYTLDAYNAAGRAADMTGVDMPAVEKFFEASASSLIGGEGS